MVILVCEVNCMYLRRKIDDYLKEWKNSEERKPLIIKGARQIGKTESIRKFAEENYTSVIEINFVEEPKYRTIIVDGYGADEIVKSISRIDPQKQFIPEETLIFFDELQEFPEIATSLKFLLRTDDLTLYAAGLCWEFHIRGLKVTVLDTRMITRCILWILRNFCGRRDIKTM